MEELFAMAPAALELQSNPGRYARTMEQALADPGRNFLTELLDRFFNVRVLVPLVATAAIALLIINPFSGPASLSHLADFHALPYSQIDVRSGNNGTAVQHFTEGMGYYQQADYCTAGPLLVQALEGGIEPEFARDQGTLYAGVSYLICGQNEKALAMLNLSAESTIQPVAQKSLWYLGQTHLQDNNKLAAVAALESLLDSPVYARQAQELLDKIEAEAR